MADYQPPSTEELKIATGLDIAMEDLGEDALADVLRPLIVEAEMLVKARLRNTDLFTRATLEDWERELLHGAILRRANSLYMLRCATKRAGGLWPRPQTTVEDYAAVLNISSMVAREFEMVLQGGDLLERANREVVP